MLACIHHAKLECSFLVCVISNPNQSQVRCLKHDQKTPKLLFSFQIFFKLFSFIWTLALYLYSRLINTDDAI